ncbi:protein of unknown function [Streptomyces murinus]
MPCSGAPWCEEAMPSAKTANRPVTATRKRLMTRTPFPIQGRYGDLSLGKLNVVRQVSDASSNGKAARGGRSEHGHSSSLPTIDPR